MVTINFHKFLQPYTNKKSFINIEVNTYLDIMRACSGLFPKFFELIKKCTNKNNKHEEICLIVDGKAIKQEELLFQVKKNAIIILVPLIYGSGKVLPFIGIALAIAFIVVIALPAAGAIGAGAATAGVTGGAGGAAATTGAAVAGAAVAGGVATGVSIGSLGLLALGIAFNLITALLAPKIGAPKIVEAVDAGQRRNNDVFDSLQNTTTSGPILLNYGLTRVSGQFVSGYVKTINHGPTDIIRIGNEFIR